MSYTLLLTLTGLIIGISLTLPGIHWYITYILFALPFLFVVKNRKIVAFSLGIITGFITTFLHTLPPSKPLDRYITRAEGVIVSSRPSTFGAEYIVKIKKMMDGDKQERGAEKILLKVNDRSVYLPLGSYIIMENLFLQWISPPKNPYISDYRRYIERKGVHFEGRAKSISIKEEKNILFLLHKIRQYIIRKIDAKFLYYPEEKELLFTITLGKEKVPYFLQSSGIRSGTYHLLVISGLHISFILLFLKFLLLPFAEINNRHPKFFPVFALITVWLYATITGLRVPVVRATLMCSLFFIGEIFERDMDIITSIIAAALLLLIINPYNLVDVSFQLSFIATLGIILFWMRFKLIEKNYVKIVILTSLSAQISVLPLLLYHFGYFYPLGIFNNIIFVPFTGALVILSFVSFIVPVLFPVLRVLLTIFIRGITLSTQFSPSINFSLSIPLAITFYLVFFLLLYSPKRRFINTTLLSIIFVSISLHFLPSYQKVNENEEIYFLSSTKVSVVYIKDREATLFLADHYRTREIEDILIPLLSRKGIRDIILFYTTISYNHTATLNRLTKRFNIKRVYEVEVIKDTFAFPYVMEYYHTTKPELFEFLPEGENISLSGIDIELVGEENGTLSYIISKETQKILIAPFIGQKNVEKLSGKEFTIAYINGLKKTKKIQEQLSSIKYRYLILPFPYKKFEELISKEIKTLYIKHSAVKVLFNKKEVDVKYHYQDNQWNFKKPDGLRSIIPSTILF
ncbi:MAG: ComEC family competence protein [Candidatus Omnitrophica bacterium]|nr:ComEC family competence protein [Candidatus Omnitrophota bacterium]